jgi:hypothetical protein
VWSLALLDFLHGAGIASSYMVWACRLLGLEEKSPYMEWTMTSRFGRLLFCKKKVLADVSVLDHALSRRRIIITRDSTNLLSCVFPFSTIFSQL